MAPPVRYTNPCPDHPGPIVYRKHCKHCQALHAQLRRAVSRHGVPVFRELHWPAPEHAHG